MRATMDDRSRRSHSHFLSFNNKNANNKKKKGEIELATSLNDAKVEGRISRPGDPETFDKNTTTRESQRRK